MASNGTRPSNSPIRSTAPNVPNRTDLYASPYSLLSIDHAGLQIVTDQLDARAEFHSWKRSVRMALNVRNKLGFIDGTISKPPLDHPDSDAWSRCNDIQRSGKNLVSRFKQDDAPRVYEIEQRLSTIQQGDLDVSAYYTELITLWEEYTNYIELPVCTCGHCECNAAILWEKLQQRSRVTKFLMGLNESYEQTRRHILMLKPIPDIEEAYNIVAQDERQRVVKPVIKTESVAFQATGSFDGNQSFGQHQMEFAAAYNTYRPRGNLPLCTHCGKLGHTVQTCFKVHEYPPGYKPPGSMTTGQSGSKSTFVPKQRTVANVFTEQQSSSLAGINGATPASMPYYPSLAVNPVNLDVSRLTQEQAQTLINQLTSHAQSSASEPPVALNQASISEQGVMAVQSSSGKVFNISSNLRYENHILTYRHHCLSSLQNTLPSGSWIIDSGATSHVCCDLSRFRETYLVSGVMVTLPDGNKLEIKHVGTIHLSDALVLYNVLYVPAFQFNMISESSQGWMIGSGRLYRNLYILNTHSQSASTPAESPACVNFCGTLSTDGCLWHQRLGHPSVAKLQSLASTSALSKSIIQIHDHCHICPLVFSVS
ncbi:PREDICTED: uncharacterized protein LOC104743769 [Camelina sativa]|uniref:Uncharacterized protein LOC104743769 n=1 Tax=Camelina sativa TaxID=90675 RepID=A0ABM0VYK7_CAMSA|nr:PREDICTED: uncharacterized protein LOC104743769 [Camelina sativa]